MARIISNISYLTTDEAARQLCTTRTRILMLLKQKALEGMQLEGEWLVASDSAACFETHGGDSRTAGECISGCSSARCGCK